jgi:hypothetical protein
MDGCSRVFLWRGWVLGVGVFPGAAGTSRHIFQKLVVVASAVTQVAARVRWSSIGGSGDGDSGVRLKG